MPHVHSVPGTGSAWASSPVLPHRAATGRAYGHAPAGAAIAFAIHEDCFRGAFSDRTVMPALSNCHTRNASTACPKSGAFAALTPAPALVTARARPGCRRGARAAAPRSGRLPSRFPWRSSSADARDGDGLADLERFEIHVVIPEIGHQVIEVTQLAAAAVFERDRERGHRRISSGTLGEQVKLGRGQAVAGQRLAARPRNPALGDA